MLQANGADTPPSQPITDHAIVGTGREDIGPCASRIIAEAAGSLMRLIFWPQGGLRIEVRFPSPTHREASTGTQDVQDPAGPLPAIA